jgi:hypothetical protein
MSYHDGFRGFPYLALVNLPPAAFALVYAALMARRELDDAERERVA